MATDTRSPTSEFEGLADTASCSSSTAGWCCCAPTTSARVVYHRQGRIGTYAIFWNHEAMQAGSVVRARRRGLDLPELPRVGDRPPARHAGRDGPALVARASGGMVEPGRLQRRVDLRPDRHARSARRRSRVGKEAEGRERGRDRLLRRRRDERGRVPRGRELRGGHEGAARSSSATTTSGRSRRRFGADARGDARGQGGRLRHARACVSTAATSSPCTRRRARRSSARVRATARRFIEAVTTARRRTRPRTTRAPTSTSSASRRSGRTSASGATSATCCELGVLTDERVEESKQAEALAAMRQGSPTPRRSPTADPELVFEHAYVDPPAEPRDGWLG